MSAEEDKDDEVEKFREFLDQVSAEDFETKPDETGTPGDERSVRQTMNRQLNVESWPRVARHADSAKARVVVDLGFRAAVPSAQTARNATGVVTPVGVARHEGEDPAR